MTAFCGDCGILTLQRYRLLLTADGGSGLECYAEPYGLTVAYTSLNASAVI